VCNIRETDVAGSEGPYRPGQRVVRETLADTGAVDQWDDSDPAEVIRRTDTRHLEQLRRAESAGAKDDLVPGESPVFTSSTAVFDSDGTTVAHDHAIARLFVSPRTVQAHLTHVYTKLGLASRVQLAQEAGRHA
jgi:hypothetical protein